MKITLVSIFLLCAASVYSQTTISTGIVNDNLIDLPGIPLDTIFGGADDRYTFALFMNCCGHDWKTLLHYQSVTMRCEGYRYDSLTLLFIKTFSINHFYGSVGGGFDAFGNFGSAAMQNSLHRLLDFPELDLRYLHNDLGINILFGAGYSFFNLFDDHFHLGAEIQCKLALFETPGVFTFGFPLDFSSDNIFLEIYSGGNLKYSPRREYLAGNSIFYKVMGGLRIFDQIVLNIGFSRSFIYYSPYEDNFTQYNKFTTGFTENLSVLEIPEFFLCAGLGHDSVRLKDLPLP